MTALAAPPGPTRAPVAPGRQLTVRAVLTGMVIGGVLCLSNVYVVLKTGWSLGITLSSCILAFAFFRALQSAGVVKEGLTALENDMVSSVASSAAFMTGGGNMAALPALLLLTGARPHGPGMFAWFFVIAALGVVTAIPLKRRIIDVEQLPFPSAVATAEAIRAMHAGKAEGGRAAKMLGTGALAALFTVVRDLKASWMVVHLPGQLALPLRVAGAELARWSLALDLSPVLFGGGSLMGLRTAWSMLLGAITAYGVLAPAMVERGVIAAVEYKAIVQLTLWPGAGLLVASGLVSLLLQGRLVLDALRSLASRPSSRGGDAAAPRPRSAPSATDEAPLWWFPAGLLVLGPVLVVLMHVLFDVPWLGGVLAIPLALVMAVVAARVTGETDITPSKAIGPATQLVYGGLLPGDLTANVMSGNVTGGIGLHAADTLTDLKSGWILGASPRQQTIAQLFGVLAGALVVVPAFELLVPSADVLGTERFPAPAVMVWANVSKVLAGGFGGLSPAARTAALVGLAAGVVLTLLEQRAPLRWRRFVPSPAALGIAMVMPGSSSISMFTGAAVAALLRRTRPSLAGERLVPISSGLIAGESLTGVVLALLRTLG